MPVYARVTADSSGATDWIPLARHESPFNVGFGVSVIAPGASAAVTPDFSVQHTFVDVMKGASAGATDIFDHSDVSGQSASIDGNYAFPVVATRLFVSALASGGSMIFTVIQSGT